jgi:hypothetical protein
LAPGGQSDAEEESFHGFILVWSSVIIPVVAWRPKTPPR